jgi:hypothetical protein
MTLLSNWQARYSSIRQVQLTRPDAPTSTTADTTFAGYGVTDITAELLNVGITYSDTNPQHVACAVAGVTAWCLDHGADPAGGAVQKWRDSELERLRLATSQNRAFPDSTSELTTSDEVEDGQTVYPDFDRAHFRLLIPGDAPTDPNAYD